MKILCKIFGHRFGNEITIADFTVKQCKRCPLSVITSIKFFPTKYDPKLTVTHK